MRALLLLPLITATLLAAGTADADDLFHGGEFSSLASDRLAQRVGDTLTVAIDQNSLATNTAQNGYKKDTNIGGTVQAGSFNKTGQFDINGGFTGTGQTGRTDRIVAQVTVVVDKVLPNGDLEVEGTQALKINGERTNIRVKGLVRPADIGSNNTISSTRIANAAIDYDGAGFVTSGSKGGIVDKILGALHLP